MILPRTYGHPVKRVHDATEVDHDQNKEDRRGDPEFDTYKRNLLILADLVF